MLTADGRLLLQTFQNLPHAFGGDNVVVVAPVYLVVLGDALGWEKGGIQQLIGGGHGVAVAFGDVISYKMQPNGTGQGILLFHEVGLDQ